jgi:Ca2+-transporting ATPase
MHRSWPKPLQCANLTGLDPAEAARRPAARGPNLLPGSTQKCLLAISIDVVIEPMFLMLPVAGGVWLAPAIRAGQRVLG